MTNSPSHVRVNTPTNIIVRGFAAWVFCVGACIPGSAGAAQSASVPPPAVESQASHTQELNRRLEQLSGSKAITPAENPDLEYRIGAQDLLDINVFEAPELNRSLRVSASGDISMPLVGNVAAAGLTARELEVALQRSLARYMKDPHVGVLVSAVESHPISVMGEVNKPGVFQVRGPKNLLEVLSLGQGLTPDAGDDVLVVRAGAANAPTSGILNANLRTTPAGQSLPAASAAVAEPQSAQEQTVDVKLKDLLDSGGAGYDVPVYPGDVVEVTKAGIVYVVGSVKKPGGFVLKSGQPLSVLQAVALAEGLTNTSAKSRARLIRTDAKTGARSEMPLDLGKILSGKSPDEVLQAADIVFVPDSTAKSAFYRGAEAAITTASGVAVWRF